MTAVVSDTSPINYLCLIDAIGVLPSLFDRVLIPPAVMAELRHPKAPPAVANWLANLPDWVQIQSPSSIRPNMGLDPGETEAISLAIELSLPAILIDERVGRIAAEECGIAAIGTLNILDSADKLELLRLEDAVARLRMTNFHIDSTIVDALVVLARARKSSA